MTEHEIQSNIRVHIAKQKLGVCFRVNVGTAWTADKAIKNPDGTITLINPRRFVSGVPAGFSDLFGVTNTGKAVFVEVKSKTGKTSKPQQHFLSVMHQLGAYTGIARSPKEAEMIYRGQNYD